MEVQNNRLSGSKVKPFVQAHVTGTPIVPDTIIIHYTAGPSGDATVRLFASPTYPFSAHIVVNEDGMVTQMIDFTKLAAHAGTSAWGGRTSFNKFSIGIEISNPGYLVPNTKGPGFLPWWEINRTNPQPVADNLVITANHRNKISTMTKWCKYPEVQIASVYEICEALIKAYNIKYILGHEEICVGMKTDPGPAFPLDEMRNKLLAPRKGDTVDQFAPVVNNNSVVTSNDSLSNSKSLGSIFAQAAETSAETAINPTGTTSIDKLNIRSNPSFNAPLIANPLPAGTKVEILKEQGLWNQIIFRVTGWVFREYVQQNTSDDPWDAVVSVDTLNIRADHNPNSNRVAEPLIKGQKLWIIKQVDHWYLVNAKITGWVSKAYINREFV